MSPPADEMIPKGEECCKLYGDVTEAIDFLMGIPAQDSAKSIAVNDIDGKSTAEKYTPGVQLAMQVFRSLSVDRLEKLRVLVEALSDMAVFTAAGAATDRAAFLGFLRAFCNMNNYGSDPLGLLRTMLSASTDPAFFEATSLKIFRGLFFCQRAAHVSFYELSLATRLHRVHFAEDAHVQRVVTDLARCFVSDISKSFAAKETYVLSRRFLNGFAVRMQELVNAFNGLVCELAIDQAAISKIVFILLVFSAERKRSAFMQIFGEPELVYCAVRTLYSGIGFAKRLENFMKTRLLWESKMDKTNATLDRAFQTLYKYEYKKIIGSQQPQRIVASRYMSRVASMPSCATGRRRGSITTSVLPVTPRMSRTRAVSAFSPLSRRIGENAGARESFDSKRRLDFK